MVKSTNSSNGSDSQDAKPEDSSQVRFLAQELRASNKELEELGLLSRDDLVISMRPSPRQGKQAKA